MPSKLYREKNLLAAKEKQTYADLEMLSVVRVNWREHNQFNALTQWHQGEEAEALWILYLVLFCLQANIVAELEHASKCIMEHCHALFAQSKVEDHHVGLTPIDDGVYRKLGHLKIKAIPKL